MRKLIEGIHRFQKQVFPARRELFASLAEGQHPQVLLITCSDSRICPDLITQSDPGDLFVVRNAGNMVPQYAAVGSSEDATIELAVAKLAICDIVVCGHYDCGAMKAILAPGYCHGLPALGAWLSHAEGIRQIVRKRFGTLEGNELLRAVIETNVLVQLENLRTHPVVAAGLATGKLKLHGWVYRIGTGEVFAYQPELRRFAPLRYSLRHHRPPARPRPRALELETDRPINQHSGACPAQAEP